MTLKRNPDIEYDKNGQEILESIKNTNVVNARLNQPKMKISKRA
jgi:hypothetical protein